MHDLRGSPTSTASHTNTAETLKFLECPSDTIDSLFLASAAMFRNLVTPYVCTHCPATERCTFRLTGEDMENFATTLPRLKNLELGQPCHSDSCGTTFASLLSISTNCLNPVSLETHFNTAFRSFQRADERKRQPFYWAVDSGIPAAGALLR